MTGQNPLFGNFSHPSDIRKNYQETAHATSSQQTSSFEKSRLIEKLRLELPPTFSRKFAASRLGGLISAKTLSNLDAKNDGPANKITMGRRVAYEKDDFLAWLEKRLHTSEGHT